MSVMFFPKALKSACVVATRAHANAKNEYYAIFPLSYHYKTPVRGTHPPPIFGGSPAPTCSGCNVRHGRQGVPIEFSILFFVSRQFAVPLAVRAGDDAFRSFPCAPGASAYPDYDASLRQQRGCAGVVVGVV